MAFARSPALSFAQASSNLTLHVGAPLSLVMLTVFSLVSVSKPMLLSSPFPEPQAASIMHSDKPLSILFISSVLAAKIRIIYHLLLKK
jgi:hypothetical protein